MIKNVIKNVVVGMSGGVDSAVTALLLKQKGFNVSAVFMKNWDSTDEKGVCLVEKDYKDAQWVCDKLEIPLTQVDFVKEYWIDIFSYLIDTYQQGGTPNPDILCNKNIKFDKFFKLACSKFQADAIATGHYARSSFGPYLEHFKPDTDVKLLQARDANKDQTFFLCQVPQESLRRTLFPLGDYFKSDVKRMALKAGLEPIVKKKESTGICFIGKREFKNFISEYTEKKIGKFIDFDTGAVLGQHEGIHLWTVGQKCTFVQQPRAYFVLYKDITSNNIVVVNRTDHPALFSNVVITAESHWIRSEPDELRIHNSVLNCDFRFQHRDPLIPCQIYKIHNNQLIVRLSKPLRALTKGQFAVFYLGEECLGGSKIVNLGASNYGLNRQLENLPQKGDNDDREKESILSNL